METASFSFLPIPNEKTMMKKTSFCIIITSATPHVAANHVAIVVVPTAHFGFYSSLLPLPAEKFNGKLLVNILYV